MTDIIAAARAICPKINRSCSRPGNRACDNGCEGPAPEAVEIVEAVLAVAGKPVWQPIETAPFDDRFALIYWRTGNVSVDNLDHDSASRLWRRHGATHWMPLPKAPEAKDGCND